MSLCGLFLMYPHGSISSTPFDPAPRVIKMNESTLNAWYDPVGACMVRQTGNLSYWDYLGACKTNSTTPARFNDGFFTLPSSAFANKVRGTCCTEDVPLASRGFNEVMEVSAPVHPEL
jgi:hypothetical protein